MVGISRNLFCILSKTVYHPQLFTHPTRTLSAGRARANCTGQHSDKSLNSFTDHRLFRRSNLTNYQSRQIPLSVCLSISISISLSLSLANLSVILNHCGAPSRQFCQVRNNDKLAGLSAWAFCVYNGNAAVLIIGPIHSVELKAFKHLDV